jgi:hypothetical protein
LIFCAARIDVGLRGELAKSLPLNRKGLTAEMEVDNLKKFAKTSYAAEVILDRLK